MQEKIIRHDLIKDNFKQIFVIDKENEKARFNYGIYLLK